jgi:hypothetical protein
LEPHRRPFATPRCRCDNTRHPGMSTLRTHTQSGRRYLYPTSNADYIPCFSRRISLKDPRLALLLGDEQLTTLRTCYCRHGRSAAALTLLWGLSIYVSAQKALTAYLLSSGARVEVCLSAVQIRGELYLECRVAGEETRGSSVHPPLSTLQMTGNGHTLSPGALYVGASEAIGAGRPPSHLSWLISAHWISWTSPTPGQVRLLAEPISSWTNLEPQNAIGLYLCALKGGRGLSSSCPTGAPMIRCTKSHLLSMRKQLVRIDGSWFQRGEFRNSAQTLPEKLPKLTLAAVLVRSTRYVREYSYEFTPSRDTRKLAAPTATGIKY